MLAYGAFQTFLRTMFSVLCFCGPGIKTIPFQVFSGVLSTVGSYSQRLSRILLGSYCQRGGPQFQTRRIMNPKQFCNLEVRFHSFIAKNISKGGRDGLSLASPSPRAWRWQISHGLRAPHWHTCGYCKQTARNSVKNRCPQDPNRCIMAACHNT